MKLLVTKAKTSKIILIFIQDSSSTTGAGLTGLVFNSSSLTAFYYREGQGTGATAITLVTMTIGTWVSSGFVEIDASDMPGWYELSLPDAVLATGVDYVGVQLKGATNMAQLNLEIQLTNFDMNDAVRGGLTALPNAAADAAGGLTVSDAGGLDLDAQDTNIDDIETAVDAILVDTGTTIPALLPAALVGGRIDANVGAVSGDATAADNLESACDNYSVTRGLTGTALPAAVADAAGGVPISDAGGLNLDDIPLKSDTLTEPSQAAPPTTGVADWEDAMRYVYFALTNRVDSDAVANFLEFFNRAGTTVQWKKALTDAGSIGSEASGVTGP